MTSSRKHVDGNIASPELATEAMAEWTTEDFLAAEPYPMPEVTEEMVQDFIDTMMPPPAKGEARRRAVP